MNNDIIEIIDLSGERKKYDDLITFDSDNTNKSYVVYTNYQKNEDNRIIVYASTYKYVNNELILKDVDTQKEIDFINDFLIKQQEKVNYYLNKVENK